MGPLETILMSLGAVWGLLHPFETTGDHFVVQGGPGYRKPIKTNSFFKDFWWQLESILDHVRDILVKLWGILEPLGAIVGQLGIIHGTTWGHWGPCGGHVELF